MGLYISTYRDANNSTPCSHSYTTMVKYLGIILAVGAATADYDCDWEAGTCVTDNWCNGMANGYHFMDTTEAHLEGKYRSCSWGEYAELQCPAGQLWYVHDDVGGDAVGWNGFCNFAEESIQEIGGSGWVAPEDPDAEPDVSNGPVCDYTTGLCA